jgi:hypothetical protein
MRYVWGKRNSFFGENIRTSKGIVQEKARKLELKTTL